MDDFNLSTLHESKSEWASRVLIIMTPLVIEGLRSIFTEASRMCTTNGEPEKYLMTFQNFLLQIPKWSNSTVETERKRIIERSQCPYLEDLITCVHIVQLKILTAMRVGTKQKKINIDIPKLDTFIHKTYINVARKVYNNVYLYETGVIPLQVQKNHRELEIIIQECILNTIRESIPVETILRAYMDETVEEEVIEEKEEMILAPEPSKGLNNTKTSDGDSDFAPTYTNPELDKLRDMQKMIATPPSPPPQLKDDDEVKLEFAADDEETADAATTAFHNPPIFPHDTKPAFDKPIMVDLEPLSRPPSVETIPMESTSTTVKLTPSTNDAEVMLEFDTI